jgi:hypothetical protein
MIPPKKTTGSSKEQGKYMGWWNICVEKQFQKYFVPGINNAIDESTVWFTGKKNFKIYNPKSNIGHWIICISWQWHWLCSQYNSILRKAYRWREQLAILWKTVHFKNSSFLDGQTRTKCVWCWRLPSFHKPDDIHPYKVENFSSCIVLSTPFASYTLCPCCTKFSGKTVHLVALQTFKTPSHLGCRISTNATTGKG